MRERTITWAVSLSLSLSLALTPVVCQVSVGRPVLVDVSPEHLPLAGGTFRATFRGVDSRIVKIEAGGRACTFRVNQTTTTTTTTTTTAAAAATAKTLTKTTTTMYSGGGISPEGGNDIVGEAPRLGVTQTQEEGPGTLVVTTVDIDHPGTPTTGYETLYLSTASSERDGIGAYSYPRAVYASDNCLAGSPSGRSDSGEPLPLFLDGECVTCPVGAFCPGGARVWPQAGYYTPGESSGTVVACEPRERCLGGRDSACGRGYEGEYCGRCARGYRMERDTCVACETGQAYGLRTYYLAVIGSIVFVALVLHDRILTTLLSAVMTLQVLAAVGKMATSEMPTPVRRFYSYLSALNLDFEGLQPGCNGLPDQTFTAMFFGNIAFVLCLWVVIAVALGILWVVIPRRRRFYGNRLFSSALLVVAIFYFILSTRALEAITCYRIDGVYRLQSDVSMVCWEGPHIKLAAMGCFALLVFTLGFPWWISTRLNVHHPVLYEDKSIRAKYGMLYDSFKPSYYSFGILTIFVDMLLALASVVFRYNPIVQVSIVAGVLLIYCLALLCQRPFRNPLETIATFFAFLIASVGAALNFIGIAAARDDQGLDEIRTVADTLDVGVDGAPRKDSGAFAIMAYTVVALTSLVVLCFVYLLAKQIVVAIVHKRKGREGSAYYDEDGWVDDESDEDAMPPERMARLGAELGLVDVMGHGGRPNSGAGGLSRTPSTTGLLGHSPSGSNLYLSGSQGSQADLASIGIAMEEVVSVRGDNNNVHHSNSLGREGSAGNLRREGSAGNLRREGSAGNLRREGSAGNLGREGSAGNLRREGSVPRLSREPSAQNLTAAASPPRLQQRRGGVVSPK